MTTYTETLNEKQIKKFEDTYKKYKVTSPTQYIKSQWKIDGCTITLYNSNKVVFQGVDASDYYNLISKKSINDKQNPIVYPQAGSDEVGTGDYFGPVCVCACIVDLSQAQELKKLNINDSKVMTDEYILEIGEKVKSLCTYSVLVLHNKKYNEIQPTNNLNRIKARLHNHAYVKLSIKKSLPKLCVVDQFTPKNLYYNYLSEDKKIVENLHFETKAESKYLSVACASVIARYTFLLEWKNMEEQYNFNFPKGASKKVDERAAQFLKLYGSTKLSEVAKIHFINSEKLKEYL
ncbi:MAG: ribonuclease HIII [Anaerorhabdus sp.]